MQKRLEIYKVLLKEKKDKTFNLINSTNKVYGACRHRKHFHMYKSLQPLMLAKNRQFGNYCVRRKLILLLHATKLKEIWKLSY